MRHRRTRGFILGAFAAACMSVAFAAVPARSFQLSGAGARLGTLDPDGRDQSLAIGGHLDFEQSESRFHLNPGFLFWSNDGLSDLNPNFDVYYHFANPKSVSPYLGAGLGLHIYSADGSSDPGTDLGANMFGGVLFPGRGANWFVEGRYAATDRSQASLLGGVTLPLGH